MTGDDAVVPEGKGFMGKDWDGFVPPPAVWKECMRVLKPGGHMAVFAGARTQDLMGLSIRLAGFEIRDTLGWIYGSGIPKSIDISKAIDKGQGVSESRAYEFTEWMRSTGITAREINEATGTQMGSHYLTDKSQPAVATADIFDKLRPLLPEVPERIERLVSERTGDYAKREVVGKNRWTNAANPFIPGGDTTRVPIDITAPASDAAKQWNGWGTALKTTIEPIILARKPLVGTVAGNVLEYGVGGLNIDASRVPSGESDPAGRFPANVLLDEHASAEVDEQRDGASRFFPVFKYQAKAPKKERPVIELKDGTKVQHPTVKPVGLMEWLVTLITPPGGTVLDPFTGSGTTLEAAKAEGFNSVGIEMGEEYILLIEERFRKRRERLEDNES